MPVATAPEAVAAERSARPARAGMAPLVGFFALAFALSWAWWVPLALSGEEVRRGDGWPTHVPALIGPALAALVMLAVVEGRAGVRAWLAAMVRWPRSRRWQAATVAPLAFLAVGVVVVAATGRLPSAKSFVSFSGAAATVPALALAGVVNVFGEEAGWRGYALPRLEGRFGALRGTLVLSAAWALWHTPMFFLLASYRNFSPLAIPGFFIGLTAGALVLTSIYNHTGGSILACAVWHGAYNLAAATAAADGSIAAIATAAVIFWAVGLGQRERAGQPALGRPPATLTSPP
jgi:CAAX protease family protein